MKHIVLKMHVKSECLQTGPAIPDLLQGNELRCSLLEYLLKILPLGLLTWVIDTYVNLVN